MVQFPKFRVTVSAFGRNIGAVSMLILGLSGLSLMAGLVVFARASQRQAVDAAVASARGTLLQYRMLREYYTENVLSKVMQLNTQPGFGFDSTGKPGLLPLPATFIHDLNARLDSAKSTTRVRLYSAYPFPNRQGRELDAFGRAGLEFLEGHPDSLYVAVDAAGSGRQVRVAMADRMVHASCVSCHNSVAQSPKRDWKIGDVRGALEVDLDIEAPLRSARASLYGMGAVFGGALALLALLFAVTRRFVLETRRRTSELRRAVEKAAAHDLTVAISVEGRDDIGRLAAGIGALIRSLRDTVGVLRRTAAVLGNSSSNLSEANLEADSSARQTVTLMSNMVDEASALSQEVSTVATATEEMSSSIQEIARHTLEANGVARDAVAIVGRAREEMNRLDASSAQIGEVLNLIQRISEQTHLLALNAGIEAARAGEAGKGFAVVANEVKGLARSTTEATEDIAAKIASIQIGSGSVSLSMKELGLIIERISSFQSSIASAVEQQTATTQEMNRSLAKAATAGRNMADEAKGLKVSSESASLSLERTMSDTSNLAAIALDFEGFVSEFKA